MAQIDARYDTYTKDYEASLKKSHKSVQDFKSEAWGSFCEVGLPIARKGNEKEIERYISLYNSARTCITNSRVPPARQRGKVEHPAWKPL